MRLSRAIILFNFLLILFAVSLTKDRGFVRRSFYYFFLDINAYHEPVFLYLHFEVTCLKVKFLLSFLVLVTR